MDKDCLFCKIIRGDIESQKIYENDNVFAMLDASPISPGHTMVLPKVHAENILDLPDDKLGPFMEGIKKVTEMLEDSLDCDGFTMGINHNVGQAIDHLHFHIIPRWEGDNGTSLHGVVTNPPKKSLEEMRDLIVSGD